jgi:hypothetical protein
MVLRIRVTGTRSDAAAPAWVAAWCREKKTGETQQRNNCCTAEFPRLFSPGTEFRVSPRLKANRLAAAGREFQL